MCSYNIFSVLLLLASASVALFLGFFALDAEVAVQVIKYAGYWLLLLVFGLLLYNLWLRIFKCCQAGWRPRRSLLASGACIACVSVALLSIQSTSYKITMDEPVLAVTSLRMHEYKEVMVTVRAHELQGVFTQLDGYVDKRPYFYPFLVSLLHDLTGYRSSNAFVLNALLTPLFLSLLFICGQSLRSKYGGYLAVLLFATVPLLAMNTNGGGFELLNLVMILSTLLAAKSYLNAPSMVRLNTLILLGLLLAQTRYESVVYVLAVAFVAVVGWFRMREIIISPTVILAPLLLVPFPLQQIIFSDYQQLWQLKDGVERPFMLSLIPGNLNHAANFFFNYSDDQQPNSLLLSVLFVLGLFVCVVTFLKWARNRHLNTPEALAMLPMSFVVIFNFFLLMAYHWGQLDDVQATRIVLPFILFQVLFVVFVGGKLLTTRAHVSIAFVVVGIYFVGVTVPLCARSDFLRYVPDQHQAVWVKEQVEKYEGDSVLFVSNRHLVALAERVPAIPEYTAKQHKAELNLHHNLGTYSQVLFIYKLLENEKTSGEFVPATPVLKDFKLQTIDEVFLGQGRMLRVARLIDVNWRDDDARDLDLSGYEKLEPGLETLQFYARTLP